MVILLVVVLVGGLTYKYLKKPGKVATGPTPIEVIKTATLTPNEMVNWETYRNEKYGFEFEYPVNWVVEESKGDGDPMLSTGFYIYDSKDLDKNHMVLISRNVELDKDVKPFISSYTVLEKQTVKMVRGLKWFIHIIKAKESGIEYNKNWMTKDDIIISISSEYQDNLNLIVSRIISSFKFIK